MEELSNIVWGRWSYGEIIKDAVILRVGSFCSVGRGVRAIGLLGHNKDWVTSYPFATVSLDWSIPDIPFPITENDNKVIVKNDVWIGAYATLLGGTVLHDGCIVGACSVVKKEVPPYSIVVGNPAQIIGKRFSDEVIEGLLQIKWWDWDDSKIKEYIPLLCSNQIDEFIRRVDGETNL